MWFKLTVLAMLAISCAGLTCKASLASAKRCVDQNLRKVPVGTICSSRNGSTFQLESRTASGEIWEDTSTGMVWAAEPYQTDQFDASSECESYRARSNNNILAKMKFSLPSKDDFKIAERDGFREVLPNIIGKSFWSSSIAEFDPDFFAYRFKNGHIETDDRYSANWVLCVGHR